MSSVVGYRKGLGGSLGIRWGLFLWGVFFRISFYLGRELLFGILVFFGFLRLVIRSCVSLF